MKSYRTPIGCSIVLSSFIAAANLSCPAAETSNAVSEAKQILAKDVETIQLENLPKTIGGWTFAPRGYWGPLSPTEAVALLSVNIAGMDVRNGGNGWVAGIGFRLRKPTALQKIVVHQGHPSWLDLDAIIVYRSDTEKAEPAEKNWIEVTVLKPAEWPEDGKAWISIDDPQPHRWWGICFVPSKATGGNGNISISGIRLFAR
jgi:hypothetical protein